MLDFLLWLKELVLNPLLWGGLFIATSVPQHFIARRLHHHQVWYAFVPVLKTLQWFQLGSVPTWHVVAFIPLLAVYLIPATGPEALINIITTIKVVIGLQVLLYLWFYWFRAARIITIRAGERESHVFWLLIPVVNILVLAHFALKSSFWVKSTAEKNVIEVINNGLKDDHKLSTLKNFASDQGFDRAQYEIIADKALTVKNNNLKVVTNEAYWVHFVNYFVGAALAIFVTWAAFTLLQNFSVVFSEPEFEALPQAVPEESIVLEFEPQIQVSREPSVPVRAVNPDRFPFLMEVSGYDIVDDRISLSGSIVKGGNINREAERFYLLDRNFKLLDSAKVQAITGLFGQYKVEINPVVEPSQVAFIAETLSLRESNSLGGNQLPFKTTSALAVITNHDGPATSQNRELIVDLKYDTLKKSEILYVYDEHLNRLDSAEINYLLSPTKSSVESLEPTQNVELVLEFDKPYTGEARYLSPLLSLKPLEEYLELLEL